MNKDHAKLPRLYCSEELTSSKNVTLEKEQAHYLFNVLRQKDGNNIRLFEPASGEWLCEITNINKKQVVLNCVEQLRQPQKQQQEIHLYFAPIKKNRLDFLIEKSVELGVTYLHPIITEHTEVRKLNEERLNAQIIEAAEQCERLNLPKLYPLENLHNALENIDNNINFYAAIERNKKTLNIHNLDFTDKSAFVIGPEGGFSENEISFLRSLENVTAISLGQNILRAETAALKILSCISDA